jgi:hypothetical protein
VSDPITGFSASCSVAGPRSAVEAVPGARIVGETGGDALDIAGALRLTVAELSDAYEGAIPAAFAAA